ncbi:MAG: methylated-DNA--[protein]-cysteine S-methyltransferase [Pseudomonadota bacterium]
MTDTLRYAFGDSPLGPIIAAQSGRGLAFLSFAAGIAELARHFPDTVLVEDRVALRETIGGIVDLIDHPERGAALSLDLRGTAFECQVWHALRAVPPGTTATYGEIAARLGAPRQAREVGEACAANKLAIVVPCHRIVKKDGSISGYRWGVRRKRALLEREHKACLLRPQASVPDRTDPI